MSRRFFHFFKILVFGVVRGVKRQKLAQNDKNSVCRAPFSGTIHHMIVVCGTQVKKNDISCLFFIFPKLIFHVVSGIKGQKVTWQRILSIALHISGRIHHMIVIFGTRVKW